MEAKSLIDKKFYYMLLTDIIPKKEYPLIDSYTLVEAAHKEQMHDSDHLLEILQRFHTYVALPYIDDKSFNLYRDLVFFHSFITGDTNSYVFAELSDNISLGNSKLRFTKPTINKDIPSLKYIDYDKFPVDASKSWDDKAQIEAIINYHDALILYQSLKNNPTTIYLYNLINLWIFASGYQSLTRLYSNTNLAVTLFITILEGLVKPQKCKNIMERCECCGREKIEHDSITRSKLFVLNYGDKFAKLLGIRHGTIHEGIYADIILELFEHLGEQRLAHDKNDTTSKIQLIDELELTSRYHLILLFLEHYNKTSRIRLIMSM